MTSNNVVLRAYQSELIDMLRTEFGNGYTKALAVLPCGAGKTVCFADMAARHIKKNKDNYVWFLVHRQELIEQTIETFKTFNIDITNVFIGMVQTVTRNISKYPRPTMIIFDEAHHAKAKSWLNIVEYFNDIHIVGLTATPIRLDGKPLGDIFQTLVNGVDTQWLIDNGYLCDFDYYAPTLNNMVLKRRGVDYDLQEFASNLIYGDIIKYINPTRKTIIYSPTIAFSKMLCDKINATHFDGDTPKKERKEIVEKFRKGEIKILSNVDLISEGFDIPDCDCVMLLRPTRSLSLYIQQSMRCLRPQPNKRAVIYDFVGNVHRHGLPNETHNWDLTHSKSIRNENAEPDILCRRCKKCQRVYSGANKICPYCNHDNGLTPKEIKQLEEIELQRIKKIERREVGMTKDLAGLIALGKSRGYKNPTYWAMQVLNARKKRI